MLRDHRHAAACVTYLHRLALLDMAVTSEDCSDIGNRDKLGCTGVEAS